MRIDNYGSRYHRRTKKKKTNIVLNGLIGFVLLLIIVVSINIFFGGNDDERAEQNVEETKGETSNAPEATEDESSQVSEDEASEEETETEQSSTDVSGENEEEASEEEADEEEMDENEVEEEESGEAVVSEGGSSPNVVKTIVNPAWKPVGTVQTGEHHNTYDGVDWEEMVDAISYATGISEDQMTIHFLGNNGPNKSVGTVYTKGKTEIYRVYIEWVDGQGWKPTQVEQLSAIE
ncbi:DUF1510 family protein [Robertmurraya yapensis]|uniref:DUF1510 family protein n=1 Tax=Bacillus yapensis TaxID=2492960 RepID=A0A431WIX8_9BACI|nr:YrrS family protein [Bacillus yapensis]RTR35364.1 DUF1510 family protein [Bacillus yapensis]TKS97873.1 DUF1510 family protein [Bacillus yapensis]